MATIARPGALALTLTLLLALFGLSAAPTASADSDRAGATTATQGEAPVKARATAPGVIPFVVPTGAGFTRPPDAGGSPDQEIAWNRLVEHLVDATPSGETITGSVFSLTGSDAQAALKRADKRGVKVRILLYDRRADDRNVRSLVRALNDHKTSGSWAKVCQGSCYGPKKVKATKKHRAVNPGVQHFKGFTFSTVMETATEATSDVWTAASGNLTNRGSAFNTFVVQKNNPAIVSTLNKYMVGMRADRESRPGQARVVEEGAYTMHLYPQRRLTPDPVYDTLKSNTCAAPAGVGLNGRTVVRVGIFTWTEYRDLDDQLIRLHRAGCDVAVIVSGPYVQKAVMKRLIKAGVPLFDAFHKRGASFYYIHDKNVIIDGVIDGVATKQVLTGSNNFTDGGLIRNTESIIQVADPTITDEFLANWSLIQGYAKPVTKVSQLGAKALTEPLDPENMEAAPK